MRCFDLRLPSLHIADWSIERGQVWCLLGENGAGKSQLAAALCGTTPALRGAIQDPPARVAWASFESQQQVFEQDLREHGGGYLGGGQQGQTALSVALQTGGSRAHVVQLAGRLGLGALLERTYRSLSTGEARRVMLLRAVAGRPDLLILDEPFEGLDAGARAALGAACEALIADGQALLLMVNRRADVARFTTHLAVLGRGQMVLAGERQAVLASPALALLQHFDPARVPALPPPPPGEASHFDPLVRLRRGQVRYADVSQFEGLDWCLRPGEHTLIVGENGCGKSTLLQLITGDHPQCYANDLHVFGYRRGSGESIWDIKRHIGVVSPALHRDYRVSTRVIEVVVSGLHDSIGLYQRMRPAERDLAMRWLSVLGMDADAQTPLPALSYGQQRLVLIARALIKQPPLVILDEPTQGLDDENRHLVLAFLEQLSGLARTTLLHVSHREDEHLPLFRARLRFVPSEAPGVRYRVEHTGP